MTLRNLMLPLLDSKSCSLPRKLTPFLFLETRHCSYKRCYLIHVEMVSHLNDQNFYVVVVCVFNLSCFENLLVFCFVLPGVVWILHEEGADVLIRLPLGEGFYFLTFLARAHIGNVRIQM